MIGSQRLLSYFLLVVWQTYVNHIESAPAYNHKVICTSIQIATLAVEGSHGLLLTTVARRFETPNVGPLRVMTVWHRL